MNSIGKKLGILFAILFSIPILLFAVYILVGAGAAVIDIFTPKGFGGGVVYEKQQILSGNLPEEVNAYKNEFKDVDANSYFQYPLSTTTKVPELEGLTFKGRAYWWDYFKDRGWGVLLTYEGNYWRENQHVYIYRRQTNSLEELNSFAENGMVIEEIKIFFLNGKVNLLVVRWDPWVKYVTKNGRSERIVLRKETWERPEYGLYTCGIDGKELKYICPGHSAEVSPDRLKVAFLRSAGASYSLHIWYPNEDRITSVLSLCGEADVGSGRSFDFRWSADSKALSVRGCGCGYYGYKPKSFMGSDLIYILETNRLYSTSDAHLGVK